MGMMEAVKMFFARYTDFEGRSSRAEYWWVFLFQFLVVIAAYIGMGLAFVIGLPALSIIFMIAMVLYFLAALVPGIAVIVRRLHDTDRSGWWYFIGLVPLIGGIILLIFFCNSGTKGANRFGDDPYGGVDPGVFE